MNEKIENIDELVKKGSINFSRFLDNLRLKRIVRTPHTSQLFELGTLNYHSDEFKILCIKILYYEFYSIHILEEEK